MSSKVLFSLSVVTALIFALGCNARRSRTDVGDDAGSRGDLGSAADLGVPIDLGNAEDMRPSTTCDDAALASGVTYFYVVNLYSLADVDPDFFPATSAGFNLDGNAVVACNAHTVGETAEFAGQAPDFGSGIDNTLGPLFTPLTEDVLQGEVDSGDLLTLVEVRGVDSFADDACVSVTFYRGSLPAGMAAPRLSGGRIAAGQTFNVGIENFVDRRARIVGARLETAESVFDPMPPFLPTVEVALRRARVRFDVSPTSVTNGVIGGTLNSGEFISAVSAIPELADLRDLVASVLLDNADIDENGTPVSCEAGSVSLRFGGVAAVRGLAVDR